MSQSPADVIRHVYDAFGRGDIPTILSTLDANIKWRAPDTLPHGGTFEGREAVGSFFAGLGENWDGLQLEMEAMVAEGERVVVLARIHGELRATGEDAGYSAAHVWTVQDGTPTRFDEYVDTPLSLPAAKAATA